jgi:hypothetical protein
MTRLVNRNCVVIEQPDRTPIVIGPFKTFKRACDRRDEIYEHLMDHTELEDGDFTIDAVGCHSAMTTTNEEIDGLLT